RAGVWGGGRGRGGRRGAPRRWGGPGGGAARAGYRGWGPGLHSGPLRAAGAGGGRAAGGFAVLPVHEPVAPSLSLLAVMLARGPIVATFHTATERSRFLEAAAGLLQPFMEKIGGRIAVSAAARKVQVEHLGRGARGDPDRGAVPPYPPPPPLPP